MLLVQMALTAPMEAMACGIPAIVSDRGALPELVRNGETGFVLSIEEGPEQWMQAMARLCDDPDLRARMGAAALKDVRNRFSWDKAGRETEAVLQKVVMAHSPSVR